MNNFLKSMLRYALPSGLLGAALTYGALGMLGQRALSAVEQQAKDRASALAATAVSQMGGSAHAKWGDSDPPDYKAQRERLRQLAFNQGGAAGGRGAEIISMRQSA